MQEPWYKAKVLIPRMNTGCHRSLRQAAPRPENVIQVRYPGLAPGANHGGAASRHVLRVPG